MKRNILLLFVFTRVRRKYIINKPPCPPYNSLLPSVKCISIILMHTSHTQQESKWTLLNVECDFHFVKYTLNHIDDTLGMIVCQGCQIPPNICINNQNPIVLCVESYSTVNISDLGTSLRSKCHPWPSMKNYGISSFSSFDDCVFTTVPFWVSCILHIYVCVCAHNGIKQEVICITH